MSELNTRPLRENFGLEILGVDLEAVDEQTCAAILGAWQAEPLLLFRRQFITEAELVAFSRRFGELFAVPHYMSARRQPEVMYVSNLQTEAGERLGSLSSSELNWHSDQSYQRRPATGAIFQAVEVPENEGRTSWCNMQLAYRALPADLRAELAGLAGISRYNGYERENISEEEKRKLREQYPEVQHPLVLTHPASGEKTLYLDISITSAIAGLPPERGAALLKELAAVMTRPEFVHTHTWRAGDVMMWDNGRTLHRRDAFDPALPRLAKRTTIFLRPEQFPVPPESTAP